MDLMFKEYQNQSTKYVVKESQKSLIFCLVGKMVGIKIKAYKFETHYSGGLKKKHMFSSITTIKVALVIRQLSICGFEY